MLTRGTKYAIEQFIDVLQGNMLPYPTDTGTHAVQLITRPIQLWECVFPKDCLGSVLKGINYTEDRKDISWKLAILRTALGASKIPKLDYTKAAPINSWNTVVGCYPIGIREDKGVWTEGSCKGGEQL